MRYPGIHIYGLETMTDSFKKKLVRSRLRWAGSIEKWEMKNRQREQMPIKWRKKQARKSEEDCVKRDLEKLGGEWRTTAKDRRSWRLVMENSVREK